MSKLQLIGCDRHGEKLLGYAVCQHIPKGAKVAHFEKATRTMIGEAVCAECEKRVLDVDDCVLLCAGCLSEMLGEVEGRIQ